MSKKKEPQPLPDVRTGDVWEDADPRMSQRRLEVTEVTETMVTAEVLPGRKRVTQIRRSRMRPTSTGYRLVERDGKVVGT